MREPLFSLRYIHFSCGSITILNTHSDSFAKIFFNGKIRRQTVKSPSLNQMFTVQTCSTKQTKKKHANIQTKQPETTENEIEQSKQNLCTRTTHLHTNFFFFSSD